MRICLSFLILSTILPACGGKLGEVSPSDAGADADAASDTGGPLFGDAGPPLPPADAGCNAIGQFGAPVVMQQVAQDFNTATSPPPPGPGTYALESATYYTGINGPSGPAKTPIQITISVLGNGQWQVVSTNENGEEHKNYQLANVSPEGVFKLVATCGGTDSAFVDFVQINSPGFVLVARAPNQPKLAVVEVFRPLKK